MMTGMTCQRIKAFKSKGNITANNATSIAEVLGKNGYATILAGKWHIAPEPMEVGFQNWFGSNLAPLYFKAVQNRCDCFAEVRHLRFSEHLEGGRRRGLVDGSIDRGQDNPLREIDGRSTVRLFDHGR